MAQKVNWQKLGVIVAAVVAAITLAGFILDARTPSRKELQDTYATKEYVNEKFDHIKDTVDKTYKSVEGLVELHQTNNTGNGR